MKLNTRLRISLYFLALWLFALVAMAVFTFQPEADRVKRVCTLGLVIGLMGTFLVIAWPRAALRRCLLVLVAVLAAILVIPWGERTSALDLRTSYVKQLNLYEGSPYYWGGESRNAIDCSGLIRRGLIDACFYRGVCSPDPGLLRRGLSLWWNDTSAKALGEEYRGLTKRLFSSPDLKSLDHARILPGDFAVTDDGVHVMAYIGSETWIEADPGKLQVIKIHAPTTTNGWFIHPVNIMRWTRLE